ncbi:MAG: nucleoside monophosphate kinase [Bacteriovoracia bacterium]
MNFFLFLFLLSTSVLAGPKIVLLGANGSGKGTLAAQLRDKYNVPHISTGDLIQREIDAGTPFGKTVQEFKVSGRLLPDTRKYMGVLIKKLKKRLQEEDCNNGFILDGFPRTLWQAKQLTAMLKSIGKSLDGAVLLDVDWQTVLERTSGRLVCKACEITYHSTNKKPAVEGKCDQCCQELVSRPEDEMKIAKKRYDNFQKDIDPILSYYRKKGQLRVVDAKQIVEHTVAETERQLSLYPRDYLLKVIPTFAHHEIPGFTVFGVTEMFADVGLQQYIVKEQSAKVEELNPDYLAGPEARGLPTWGAVSFVTKKPGIMIRKMGKLPRTAPLIGIEYKTAYSSDGIEIIDNLAYRGKTVVIIDDGISSGGTTLAAIELLEKAGMRVIGIIAVIEYHYREKVPEYLPWMSKTFTLFDLR